MKKTKWFAIILLMSCIYVSAQQTWKEYILSFISAIVVAKENRSKISELDHKSKLDILDEVGIMHKIELFMYQNCPYCAKVEQFLQTYNLLEQVDLLDANLPENKERLQNISGKTQAPYLVDRDADVAMAESFDIIKYIIKKFNIDITESKAPEPVIMNEKNNSLMLEKNQLGIINPLEQKKYTQDNFLVNIQTSIKPVLILITTTGCPSSKKLQPIFESISQKMSEQCEFIMLDGDIHADIVDLLDIKLYPALICYIHGQRYDFSHCRTKSSLTRITKDIISR